MAVGAIIRVPERPFAESVAGGIMPFAVAVPVAAPARFVQVCVAGSVHVPVDGVVENAEIDMTPVRARVRDVVAAYAIWTRTRPFIDLLNMECGWLTR